MFFLKIIDSLLVKLRNAKSLKDITEDELKKEMSQLCRIMSAHAFGEFTFPESYNIINAFRNGDPAAVLRKLVELRSGSASDQRSSAANLVDIDIEDTELTFSRVYSNFFSALLNSSLDVDVCRQLLSGNAIEFILWELNSTTISKYKGESPLESPTAAVINMQLGIIAHIYYPGNLRSELRRELQKNQRNLQIIKFYCTKRLIIILFLERQPGFLVLIFNFLSFGNEFMNSNFGNLFENLLRAE